MSNKAQKPESRQAYVLPSVNAPHLNTQEMNLLDSVFQNRVSQSRQSAHRLSRMRLWLVFLLVRHAALRLGEVLRVDERRDLDLNTGVLHVAEAHARDIPLPKPLLSELRNFINQPLVTSMRGQLTHLDPGYVRRNFYARARECGLSPELASPRALRQSRAIELIQSGMPLPAVQKFLGQPSLESTGELLAYSEADIKAMTRHYLQREAQLKTSARNVFPGQVMSVRQSGFMVEVCVTSFTGLEIVALITEESLENLQIAKGKTVVATVKAPWVLLAQNKALGKSMGRDRAWEQVTARNRFTGRVEKVNRSELICEVVIVLPEDSRVCALVSTESADTLNLAPGTEINALFTAMAVILTLP